MSKYNGWTNYETWCVKLWLDNDQGSDEYWRERAEEAADAGDLARMLKDEMEEAMPDLGASLWSDLLGSCLSSVDWYEIAEALREDIDDSDDEAA